jgi:hypothetical protein
MTRHNRDVPVEWDGRRARHPLRFALGRRGLVSRVALHRRSSTSNTIRTHRGVRVAIEAIDVTPDPRILSVLGDIEFSPWQCLAELIDNAFDEFLSAGHAGGERPTVKISLPSKGSDLKSAEVWVVDNGRGMDLATLNNAIRAGWTSNSAHGALGLFGMGFNIATARLGQRTQVRTTRAGDPYWTVVTLDLPALSAGHSYDVPIAYELKDDAAEHGTKVIISALRPERLALLQGHQGTRQIRRGLRHGTRSHYGAGSGSARPAAGFGGARVGPARTGYTWR